MCGRRVCAEGTDVDARERSAADFRALAMEPHLTRLADVDVSFGFTQESSFGILPLDHEAIAVTWAFGLLANAPHRVASTGRRRREAGLCDCCWRDGGRGAVRPRDETLIRIQ